MTVLPTWLTDTADAVEVASDTTKVQAEVEMLSEAQANLSAYSARLNELSDATRSAGHEWFRGHPAAPHLVEALNAVADRLNQTALGALNRELGSYVSSAREKAVLDWQGYAQERMGSVAELSALASVLSDVKTVAAIAAPLTSVLGRLAGIQRQVPTEDGFALLDEVELRLADLENALQPPAVQTFLSAVARGGASLELLTDEVRAWMRKNHAEFSFRITAGRPAES